MESIGSSLAGLKQNLNIETVQPAESKPDESVWALLLNNVRDEKSTKAVRMTRYFNILRQHDNQVGLAGFIPVYKDLMYDHRLTAKDRDIYLALECFDFSSATSPEAPSHEVHPSRELLCALTSSGYETVSRALKRLQETGWISMEMRAKPSKFGTASIWYYTILRQGKFSAENPGGLMPRAVYACPDLLRSERMTCAALACKAGASGIAKIYVRQIMAACGYEKSTYDRAARHLRSLGFVTVGQTRVDGRFSRNEYVLPKKRLALGEQQIKVRRNHRDVKRDLTVEHLAMTLCNDSHERAYAAKLLRRAEKVLFHTKKGRGDYSAAEVRQICARHTSVTGHLSRDIMQLALSKWFTTKNRDKINNDFAYIYQLLWDAVLETDLNGFCDYSDRIEPVQKENSPETTQWMKRILANMFADDDPSPPPVQDSILAANA